MEVSKIRLSPAETELMKNAEIILTKNSVLQKIKHLLEEVQQKQISFVNENNLTNNPLFSVSPKISRGENYLGLPYLILDYPRQSAGSDLFFIRTMFWWGNFFSSTLHLSGKHQHEFSKKICGSAAMLSNHFIGINDNPWMHHFEKENYSRINSFTESEFELICKRGEHLKIASSLSLEEWTEAIEKLFVNWKFFLQLCGLTANAV